MTIRPIPALLLASALSACGGGADDATPPSLAVLVTATATSTATPAAAAAAAAADAATDTQAPAAIPTAMAVAAAGPQIDREPADVSTMPGAVAAFDVEAHGRGPLAYQWLRDGEPIEGATHRQFLLAVTLDDGGSTFSVRVRDADGETESAPATLQLAEPT